MNLTKVFKILNMAFFEYDCEPVDDPMVKCKHKCSRGNRVCKRQADYIVNGVAYCKDHAASVTFKMLNDEL